MAGGPSAGRRYRHGGNGPHVEVVAVLYVGTHAEARAEAPVYEGAQLGAHC